jgi:hypothetical protein
MTRLAAFLLFLISAGAQATTLTLGVVLDQNQAAKDSMTGQRDRGMAVESKKK